MYREREREISGLIVAVLLQGRLGRSTRAGGELTRSISMYIYIYIYVQIYKERKRERERSRVELLSCCLRPQGRFGRSARAGGEWGMRLRPDAAAAGLYLCIFLCIYIYIYIYIYI